MIVGNKNRLYSVSYTHLMTISGRGTVATGRVERGMAKVGDAMEIVGIKPDRLSTTRCV